MYAFVHIPICVFTRIQTLANTCEYIRYTYAHMHAQVRACAEKRRARNAAVISVRNSQYLYKVVFMQWWHDASVSYT